MTQVRLLTLDGMPHAEQIAAFAGARVVVGQHGAALTHAAYMAEGTTLVELYPFVNANFQHLAEAVGVRHVRARGRGVYRDTGGAEDVGDHIEVEPAAIARLVPHDVGKKGGSWFGW